MSIVMVCKGICGRYKAQKTIIKMGRYASGQKRCQECSMFINWAGGFCPCCGTHLRTKPRNLKYKRIHNDRETKRYGVDMIVDQGT